MPVLCNSPSGFGNTVELSDGTLVTPFSFNNASISSMLWDTIGPAVDGVGDGCGAGGEELEGGLVAHPPSELHRLLPRAAALLVCVPRLPPHAVAAATPRSRGCNPT